MSKLPNVVETSQGTGFLDFALVKYYFLCCCLYFLVLLAVHGEWLAGMAQNELDAP